MASSPYDKVQKEIRHGETERSPCSYFSSLYPKVEGTGLSLSLSPSLTQTHLNTPNVKPEGTAALWHTLMGISDWGISLCVPKHFLQSCDSAVMGHWIMHSANGHDAYQHKNLEENVSWYQNWVLHTMSCFPKAWISCHLCNNYRGSDRICNTNVHGRLWVVVFPCCNNPLPTPLPHLLPPHCSSSWASITWLIEVSGHTHLEKVKSSNSVYEC